MIPELIRATLSALTGPTVGTPAPHGAHVSGGFGLVHADASHCQRCFSTISQPVYPNDLGPHVPVPRWKSPLSRLPAFMVTVVAAEEESPVPGSVTVTLTVLRPVRWLAPAVWASRAQW